MRRMGRSLALLVTTCLAGVGTAEFIYRSVTCREAIARLGGRGELLAIVRGTGVYRADLEASPKEDLEMLVVTENLRHASREETPPKDAIEGELNLIRAQFGDEKNFLNALKSFSLSNNSLRESLGQHLRVGSWIERQIAPSLVVTEEECRQHYGTKREHFLRPPLFRASHILLAAHKGTPAEDVEAKRKAIQALAARMSKGESLAQIAMEVSEDEATKRQGGDLGYFSASRVPPEFLAHVEKLRVGQVTVPFQSHLGFHLVQLTDLKPTRELSFEESRAEIASHLENEKRAVATARLTEQLTAADFIRR